MTRRENTVILRGFPYPLHLIAACIICFISVSYACEWAAANGDDSQKRITSDVATLAGSDSDSALDAGRDLAKIGEPAVPAVAALLHAAEPRTRAKAAVVLFWMALFRRPALSAASDLTAAMDDPDLEVKMDVDMALSTLGTASQPALPKLLQQLSSPNKRLRIEAMEVLAAIGHGASDALPAVIRDTGDPDPELRARAVRTLAFIAEPAGPILDIIADAASDSVYMVRESAVSALQRADYRTPKVRDILLGALRDPQPGIREDAAQTLATFGALAADAIPDLLPLTKDSDAMVRSCAVDALVAIRAPVKLLVPVLIHALKDPESFNRTQAADHIADIGPAAEDATAMLIQDITDLPTPETQAMENAVRKLGRWPASAAPAVANALKSHSAEIGETAIFVLARIGSPAVPPLVAMLDESNPEDCYWAMDALGALGPAAAGAVPKLMTMLRSKRDDTAAFAEDALAHIGSGAVPELAAAVENTRSRAWPHAIGALAGMGAYASEAVPAIDSALRSPDPKVRELSAWAVASIATMALKKDAIWRRQHGPTLARSLEAASRRISAMPRKYRAKLQFSLSQIEMAANKLKTADDR